MISLYANHFRKISRTEAAIRGVPENFAKLPEACNFIKKETLAQMFSCEFSEIFENTYFIEHLWWLLLHRYFYQYH